MSPHIVVSEHAHKTIGQMALDQRTTRKEIVDDLVTARKRRDDKILEVIVNYFCNELTDHGAEWDENDFDIHGAAKQLLDTITGML